MSIAEKKVLLIKPHTYHPNSFVENIEAIHPPLGLISIASMIKNDHDVTILDLDTSKKQLEDAVKEIDPDIIGITAFSPQFPEAIEIAEIAKKYNNNIITVLGGIHATAVGPKILDRFPYFDHIIQGDGELAFRDLINGKKIKGIQYIPDLNILPVPAWHMIDFKKYYDSPLYYRRKPHTIFSTSRGCMFDCIFCNSQRFRWRSPENIIKEMKMLEDMRFKDLRMMDECISCHIPRLKKLCELMIKEEIDIGWNCQTRADLLSDDIIKLMKKAGCYNIQIGIETGNRRIMDLINKKLDLSTVPYAIKKIRKHKISAYGFFMIGFPFETEKEMLDTISFAKTLDIDMAIFSIVTPFPGTKLWDDSRFDENNLEILKSLGTFSSSSLYFPKETISMMYRKAYREFYSQPRIIKKLINEVLTKGSLERKWEFVKIISSQWRLIFAKEN